MNPVRSHASSPRFDGKVAFVTGAGRGIGRVLVEQMGAAGAKVGVCDLIPERAQAAVDAIEAGGGEAIALPADVGDESQVRAAVERLHGEWGQVDILVNGAGSYGAAFRKTHETPVEEWDQVFASNVRGTFLCAKFVIPHMVTAGGGRIINVASNAGRSVSPLLGCSYTAAKTAVIGITRHLSREYAKYGILVNTIAPGPVRSERVSGLIEEESAAELATQIPIGRLAEPDDIVDVILFLASDGARFMTGSIVDVSGGLILS